MAHFTLKHIGVVSNKTRNASDKIAANTPAKLLPLNVSTWEMNNVKRHFSPKISQIESYPDCTDTIVSYQKWHTACNRTQSKPFKGQLADSGNY